jgi:hypothetical protein
MQGTQGGLNTDLLGSSVMDGVDVTQSQIQPPVEHKPHKVVQLQPSVPLVTSSLRHLVGIIMPEYHDKTSFKSYITAPTFVEDLLVGNKVIRTSLCLTFFIL